MIAPALWRRYTAPTSDGQIAGRREVVLFTVLAGLVALSAIAAVLQVASMVFGGRPAIELLWIAINAAVGVGFAALLRTARGGQQRLAAGVLIALLDALALALLLSDGPEQAMWSFLIAVSTVLTAVLLGSRPSLLRGVGFGTLLVLVTVLYDVGALHPLMPGPERHGSNTTSTLALLSLAAFLGAVLWLYTREATAAAVEATAPSPRELRRERTVPLSIREVEVVRLVANGLSNDDIARRLVLSPRTVQTHVANAMRKTACGNRTELGVLAVREGLAPLRPEAG